MGHFEALERMYVGAPINEFFRPAIKVSDGETEIRMTVRADMHHAAGAAHGSVYFKMLDDAAFFAAQSLVTDVFVLTASFTIHFLAPVSSGEMEARGRVVHRSRRLLLADSTLTVEGKTIGRGTGTFMRSAVRLDEQIGYRPVDK